MRAAGRALELSRFDIDLNPAGAGARQRGHDQRDGDEQNAGLWSTGCGHDSVCSSGFRCPGRSDSFTQPRHSWYREVDATSIG